MGIQGSDCEHSAFPARIRHGFPQHVGVVECVPAVNLRAKRGRANDRMRQMGRREDGIIEGFRAGAWCAIEARQLEAAHDGGNERSAVEAQRLRMPVGAPAHACRKDTCFCSRWMSSTCLLSSSRLASVGAKNLTMQGCCRACEIEHASRTALLELGVAAGRPLAGRGMRRACIPALHSLFRQHCCPIARPP